jgi:hypothetical protein
MATFETNSLYIAAAFLCIGREPLKIERRPGERLAFFVYSDPDGDLSRLSRLYRTGQWETMIQPQHFVNAIFDCRRMVDVIR